MAALIILLALVLYVAGNVWLALRLYGRAERPRARPGGNRPSHTPLSLPIERRN